MPKMVAGSTYETTRPKKIWHDVINIAYNNYKIKSDKK